MGGDATRLGLNHTIDDIWDEIEFSYLRGFKILGHSHSDEIDDQTAFYVAVKKKDKDEVFACVFLVREGENDDDYTYIKDMDETQHPYYYKCPVWIMELLTPTDNEYANEWRKQVWKRHKYSYDEKSGKATKIR